MGCTHQLIVDCLDFVDTEAQVSIENLSINLFYYLQSPIIFGLAS